MTESASADNRMHVLELDPGVKLVGNLNVSDEVLKEQVASAIRRGHSQVRPCNPRSERVVVVGGGPSLEDTEKELIELVWEGALLVTTNGAYHWCLERNLKPNAQIVIDARESNARFVDPAVPNCRYYLASQCHPKTWDAVANRPLVGIFHCINPDEDLGKILNEYYLDNWFPVTGGTTVTLRALALLRILGYLKFDFFGIDSCWMGGKHHAYTQLENERDKQFTAKVYPTGHPELEREFVVAPWHMKQMEDFLQMIRINGEMFAINVHGDGLLAFVLKSSAIASDMEVVIEDPKPTEATEVV